MPQAGTRRMGSGGMNALKGAQQKDFSTTMEEHEGIDHRSNILHQM
jgi:hypothetical protein